MHRPSPVLPIPVAGSCLSDNWFKNQLHSQSPDAPHCQGPMDARGLDPAPGAAGSMALIRIQVANKTGVGGAGALWRQRAQNGGGWSREGGTCQGSGPCMGAGRWRPSRKSLLTIANGRRQL